MQTDFCKGTIVISGISITASSVKEETQEKVIIIDHFRILSSIEALCSD